MGFPKAPMAKGGKGSSAWGGRSIIPAICVFLAFAGMVRAARAGTLAPEDGRMLEERAKMAGGRDERLDAMKSAMARLDDMGFAIIEDTLGTPGEVYIAGDETVCFYPRTMVMKIDGKKIRSKGFMICARKTAGGDWYFLDGQIAQNDPNALSTLLPGLPQDVKLPETRSEPVC